MCDNIEMVIPDSFEPSKFIQTKEVDPAIFKIEEQRKLLEQ